MLQGGSCDRTFQTSPTDCHISFVGTSQEFLTTEDRLTAAPRLAQIAGWAITVFVQLVTENELL